MQISQGQAKMPTKQGIWERFQAEMPGGLDHQVSAWAQLLHLLAFKSVSSTNQSSESANPNPYKKPIDPAFERPNPANKGSGQSFGS